MTLRSNISTTGGAEEHTAENFDDPKLLVGPDLLQSKRHERGEEVESKGWVVAFLKERQPFF